VQIAEFLLLKIQNNGSSQIWIVEAKNSSPRPETQPHFNDFVDEIRAKLSNTLALGVASILKRHPAAAAELPGYFKSTNLSTADFRLVLVINGHQESWLGPLQDALRSALHATVRTWALGPNAVVVINHEGAKRFALISAP
jgi:hypothetical protein